MIEIDCSMVSGEITLSGTACLPEQKGVFPVVLMIHGSGPLDRNENIKGQSLNVFNSIAHHLAEKGIASIRYDKRGCGKSSGTYYATGHFDLVDDAINWVDTLSDYDFVDKEQIYLLGHSEGCIIAPQVNIKRPSIAGLILLAPFIEPLDEILRDQGKQLQREVDAATGFSGALQRLIFKVIGQPVDLQNKLIDKIKASEKDYIYSSLRKIEAHWFRELFSINPVEIFEQTTAPILAIAGEKDLQCNPADAHRIAEVVSVPVETHVMTDLTHILRCDPDSPPSFANYREQLKQPLEGDVLDLVSGWLIQQIEQKHDSVTKDVEQIRPT